MSASSISKRRWIWLLIPLGALCSIALYFVLNLQTTEVLVASGTIYPNTRITEDMLQTRRIVKDDLPQDYLSADLLDQVVGMYTNVGITATSVFTKENIATQDTKKAAVIPEDQTLLAIHISSLPAGVVPGDRVNLLVGMSQNGQATVMTYQDIQVTNTTKNSSGDITGLEVQVTPEQAQLIQFAQLNGTLAVSLLPLGYENAPLNPTTADDANTYDRTVSGSTSDSPDSENDSAPNEEVNLSDLFR